MNGHFYFSKNTDPSERGNIFDVRDIELLKAKEPFNHSTPTPKELLMFIENEELLGSQLDIFQLWAIYLRGYDFFVQYFYGIVYGIRSAFVINNDIYLPGITFDHSKKRSLTISWYSSWNNFTDNDILLSFD